MKIGLCRSVSTLGPVGFLTASGTLGSLIALPVALFFNTVLSHSAHAVVIIIAAVASWFIIQESCKHFTEHDPREIILDEVIGCFIAFYAVPLRPGLLLFVFLFFRLLDITKLGGINYLEKIQGASGILLDDIAAGIYVNCVVHFWLLWNT